MKANLISPWGVLRRHTPDTPAKPQASLSQNRKGLSSSPQIVRTHGLSVVLILTDQVKERYLVELPDCLREAPMTSLRNLASAALPMDQSMLRPFANGMYFAPGRLLILTSWQSLPKPSFPRIHSFEGLYLSPKLQHLDPHDCSQPCPLFALVTFTRGGRSRSFTSPSNVPCPAGAPPRIYLLIWNKLPTTIQQALQHKMHSTPLFYVPTCLQ